MIYILKFYHKSKYFGFERLEYKEFNSYKDIYDFIENNKIRSCDYDIYAKVIL